MFSESYARARIANSPLRITAHMKESAKEEAAEAKCPKCKDTGYTYKKNAFGGSKKVPCNHK